MGHDSTLQRIVSNAHRREALGLNLKAKSDSWSHQSLRPRPANQPALKANNGPRLAKSAERWSNVECIGLALYCRTQAETN